MDKEQVIQAVKKAREGKKRNFIQTFDLQVALKHIDLKKPENKINTQIKLPHGRGKKVKLAFVVDPENMKKAKEFSDIVLTKEDLADLAKNKLETKKLARKVDYFVVQANLMQQLARTIGPVLGPRGKMPKPSQIMPPKADNMAQIAEFLNSAVNLAIKNQPVLNAPVGTEKQSDEEIAENVLAILSYLQHNLPNPKHQIHSVHIKTTMGKPVRIGGGE